MKINKDKLLSLGLKILVCAILIGQVFYLLVSVYYGWIGVLAGMLYEDSKEKIIRYIEEGATLQVDYKAEDAILKFEKALELAGKEFGPNSVEYGKVLLHLSSAFLDAGSYEFSLKSVRTALPILTTAPSKKVGKEYEKLMMNTTIRVFKKMGMDDYVFDLYSQTLEESRNSSNQSLYIETLNEIAQEYLSSNNISGASNYLFEADEICNQDEAQYCSVVYNNIGILYNQLGSFKDAIPYFEKALNIIKNNNNEYSLQGCNVLHNLGYSYIKTENLQNADSYLKKAKIIADSINAPVISYVQIMNSIAELSIANENYQASIDILTKNYKYLDEHTDYFLQLKINIFILFGVAYYHLGDYSKAAFFANKSLEEVRAFLQKDVFFLTPNDRVNITQRLFSTLDLQFSIYDKLTEGDTRDSLSHTIYEYIILRKGLNQKITRVHSSNTYSTNNLYIKERVEEIQQLKKLLEKNTFSKEMSMDSINMLKRTIKLKEKGLNLTLEKMGTSFKTSKVSWKKIQQTLSKDDVLVEIAQYKNIDNNEQEYVAIITDAYHLNAPRVIRIGTVEKLNRSYNLFKEDLIKSSNKSYQVFFEKILNNLPENTKNIYWSADGVFNLINIETLQKETIYIIDLFKIKNISSGEDLLKKEIYKPNRLSSKSKIALLGAPDFDGNSTSQSFTNKALATRSGLIENLGMPNFKLRLSPLPESKKEIDSIQDLFTRNGFYRIRALTGKDASEAMAKELLSSNVVHIATHGFFDPEDNQENKLYNQQKSIDPLFRSGLFFAGVNQYFSENKSIANQSENGILSAYEICNLNLNNTDLVVLSACETGLGELLDGDGVYGLQYAFRVAGVKNLIMSLWKVDDQATKLLMTEFYKHWLLNDNKSEALTHAKSMLRKSKYFNNPIFWGAFILIEN